MTGKGWLHLLFLFLKCLSQSPFLTHSTVTIQSYIRPVTDLLDYSSGTLGKSPGNGPLLLIKACVTLSSIEASTGIPKENVKISERAVDDGKNQSPHAFFFPLPSLLMVQGGLCGGDPA